MTFLIRKEMPSIIPYFDPANLKQRINHAKNFVLRSYGKYGIISAVLCIEADEESDIGA